MASIFEREVKRLQSEIDATEERVGDLKTQKAKLEADVKEKKKELRKLCLSGAVQTKLRLEEPKKKKSGQPLAEASTK